MITNWINFKFLMSLNPTYLRIALTIFVFLSGLIIRSFLRKKLNNVSGINEYEPHRLALNHKLLNVGFWIIYAIATMAIWGVNFSNLWVYLSGFLTIVAVGFFAVWSILSNIVAGLLIYLLNPFKIGSVVKLQDPLLEATVKNINVIFTELEDEEGIFSIPNSHFFQKPVKVIKPAKEPEVVENE